MKLFKNFLVILFAIFFVISCAKAWEIKKVFIYPYQNHLLVNIFYKNFPLQALVLSLKEQKYPILVNYTFEIYKKRFFLLRDILLYKEFYTQKIFYDPVNNVYLLNDKLNVISFENAEKAILKIINLESYPLEFKLPENFKSLYLKISVEIFYKTHLSNDFRYTSKIHTKRIKISKTFDLNEIVVNP